MGLMGDGNLDGNSDINLQGQNLERVNTFQYIGATLAENGDLYGGPLGTCAILLHFKRFQ